MMMAFLQISIPADPFDADQFAKTLLKLDALFVDSDEKIRNEFTQEDQINIKAVFPEDTSPRKIINQLKALLNHPEPINYRIKKINTPPKINS